MAIQSSIYSGNTIPLRPRIRHAIKVLVESLPYIGDLFHRYYLYPRIHTSCDGVFASRQDALAAISKGAPSEYDACNEVRSLQDDIEQENRHQYEDYPILFWLKGLLHADMRVADLGGSTGGTFYAFGKALQFPPGLSWTVSELPAAVEKGQRVAEARGERRLSFVTELNQVEKPDVLLTMGTLQYLPTTLSEIVGALSALPESIIVNTVPVTDADSYWTIQNLGAARVPYFVYNRKELVLSMEAIGYSLMDSCDTLRAVRIPFHSDQDVHHYSGFFFQRVE